MFSKPLTNLKTLSDLGIRKISSRFNYVNLGAAIENKSVLGRHLLNVQIQTVSACNASCYFCPYQESWHKQHPGRMSENIYRKIINEISCYKIGKFCPYLENEPLLDPNLLDRIEFALSKLDPKLVELSTNASILPPNKIDDIARLFSRVKHEIRVSFHGIDKTSFQSVMDLDFDTCKQNVLSLVEKAQQYDLKIIIQGAGLPRIKRNNMPVWFNRKQYFHFWKTTFKEQGFKRLPNVRFFTYHDRAGQIRRNEINFAEIVRQDLKGFYCPRVDQWAHFLYNGELVLCCMDYKKETVFGDITKTSLPSIYASSNFLNLSKKLIGRKPAPDTFICKKCISPNG